MGRKRTFGLVTSNVFFSNPRRVAISSEQEETFLGCRAVILGLEDRALIEVAKAHPASSLH